MLRTLPILVAALLLLPAVAWGAAYTFEAGTSSWGDIATTSGEGIVGDPVHDGGDSYTIPADASVSVSEKLIFTADAGKVTVAGTLSISVLVPEALNGIKFLAGPSSIVFDSALGSTVTLAGGYLEVGVASPEIVGSTTTRNDTEWSVDLMSPCDGAGGGTIGTCSGGGEDLFCFNYTDARNNSSAGEIGDMHFDSAMGNIVADEMWVKMVDGPEAPFAYRVQTVAATTPYEICLDVQQPGWDRTETSADYPAALRNIVAGTVATGGAFNGDTCIYVDNLISASGDFNGRYFRPVGETHPYEVIKTKNSLDCAGGAAAGDSIYLSVDDPLREDLVATTAFTLDYGFQQGNRFVIIVPVAISSTSSETDAEAQAYFGGTLSAEAVVFSGLGTVDIDGATVTKFKNVIIIDSGDDSSSLASLRLANMVGPSIDGLVITGGDGAAGGADPVVFDAVTGKTKIINSGFRYGGATAITVDSASGSLSVTESKFQYVGTAVAADNKVLLDNGDDYLTSASLFNIECTDCVDTGSSNAYEAQLFVAGTNPVRVKNLVTVGFRGFGYGTGAGLEIRNWLDRGAVTTTSGTVNGAYNLLPIYVSGCDVRGLEAPSADFPVNQFLGGTIDDCVFIDWEVEHYRPFGRGKGHTWTNTIVWNLGTYTDNSGDVFRFYGDSDAATVDVFEKMAIGWDEGAGGSWEYALAYSTITNETDVKMGSVGVWFMQNDVDASGIKTPYYQTQAFINTFDTRAGRLCTFGGSATGGGTEEYRDYYNAGYYTADIIFRNVAPQFVDLKRGNYNLVADSVVGRMGCGPTDAGFTPSDWMMESQGWPLPGGGGSVGKPRGF